MQKFVYNNQISPDTQISTEECVAAYLFENSSLDEDEVQSLSREIVMLVASKIAPHLVLEVIENPDV